MLQTAIATILDADTELEAVVGDRIYYANSLPKEVTKPYVTWQKSRTDRNSNLEGSTGLVDATLYVYCFGSTYLEACNVATAVREALDKYSGTEDSTQIAWIQIADEYDIPSAGSPSESKVQGIQQQYEITYLETPADGWLGSPLTEINLGSKDLTTTGNITAGNLYIGSDALGDLFAAPADITILSDEISDIFDWANRRIIDSNDRTRVNIDSGVIYDEAGTVSIDTNSRYCCDWEGGYIFDYLYDDGLYLYVPIYLNDVYDDMGNEAIDVPNRYLYATDGSTLMLDWSSNEIDITQGLSVGTDVTTQTYVKLYGYAAAAPHFNQRGPAIEWHTTTMPSGADKIAGYTFANYNSQIVFSDVAQTAASDTGNAYIDMTDGSALFSSVEANTIRADKWEATEGGYLLLSDTGTLLNLVASRGILSIGNSDTLYYPTTAGGAVSLYLGGSDWVCYYLSYNTASSANDLILSGYSTTGKFDVQMSLQADYFIPSTSADSSAPNNSIYYSSTQSKLCYKDSAGTVNTLY